MMKTNFNIDNKEEMVKPKQSLSFVEQLQSQIQLCREAMSDPELPLSPKVEESLTPYKPTDGIALSTFTPLTKGALKYQSNAIKDLNRTNVFNISKDFEVSWKDAEKIYNAKNELDRAKILSSLGWAGKSTMDGVVLQKIEQPITLKEKDLSMSNTLDNNDKYSISNRIFNTNDNSNDNNSNNYISDYKKGLQEAIKPISTYTSVEKRGFMPIEENE